jgi:hypothetical protein
LSKFLNRVRQENSLTQADLFGQSKQGIEVPPKDLLLKYYEESWVDDWYKDKFIKKAYREDGYKYLERFYTEYSTNPKMPKYLEHKFRLNIGDYKFTGRIDRADEGVNGKIDIIDYKTGEPRKKLETVDRDQLLIYQWAAEEFLKEKVASLSYWYFKDPAAPLKFLGTEEEIQKLKAKLLETIEDIVLTTKADNFAAKDLEKAHECQYRHLEN